MTDQDRKRPPRGHVASRVDEVTLAALAVLVAILAVAVVRMGADEAGRRVGCGLNDLVNGLLAYPRPCR